MNIKEFITLAIVLALSQKCDAYLYRVENTSKETVAVSLTEPWSNSKHNFLLETGRARDIEGAAPRREGIYKFPKITINNQVVKHIITIEIACPKDQIGDLFEIKRNSFFDDEWICDVVCMWCRD